MSPLFEIEQCRVGHERLLASLVNLSDAQVSEASRLPSWSRGHVLTHVARQGDSVVRRLRAAIEGRIVDQYAGGRVERNQAIEAGAHRSAPELVADLEASVRAVDAIFAECSEEVWDPLVRSVDGPERPARTLVSLRWQEVEIHHVDLGLGYELTEWPRALVDLVLPSTVAALVDRADSHELLGWLTGRGPAPALGPWD